MSAGASSNQAKAEAAKATAHTAELSVEAEKARLEQDRIRQQNLKLSIDLEKARSDVLAIEGKIAPRNLTAEQRQVLVQAIQRTPKPLVVFVTELGDAEASRYSRQIMSTLEEGGATVQRSSVGSISPPVYGLDLTLKRDDAGATSLLEALRSAQLSITRVTYPNIPYEINAAIFVGLKPPAL